MSHGALSEAFHVKSVLEIVVLLAIGSLSHIKLSADVAQTVRSSAAVKVSVSALIRIAFNLEQSSKIQAFSLRRNIKLPYGY